MVLAGAVLVAVLAGAGWWLSGNNEKGAADTSATPTEVEVQQVSVPSATQAAETPPPVTQPAAAVQADVPPQVAPVAVVPVAAPQPATTDNQLVTGKDAQAAAEEKALRLRDDKARRKAEQDAQRVEAEKLRRREAEERARAEERTRVEERARTEEANRRAQQPAAGGSVQQICGKYTNTFSRSLCETKECSRPSLYDTPYCVEFRKRYGNEG